MRILPLDLDWGVPMALVAIYLFFGSGPAAASAAKHAQPGRPPNLIDQPPA